MKNKNWLFLAECALFIFVESTLMSLSGWLMSLPNDLTLVAGFLLGFVAVIYLGSFTLRTITFIKGLIK